MIRDRLNDYTYYGTEEVCKLLNHLFEESEDSRKENYKLIRLIEDLGHEEMERQMDVILSD